ncbi:MAG: hypothetical protein AAGE86_00670, partial [Pseudomonadota bacterium]
MVYVFVRGVRAGGSMPRALLLVLAGCGIARAWHAGARAAVGPCAGAAPLLQICRRPSAWRRDAGQARMQAAKGRRKKKGGTKKGASKRRGVVDGAKRDAA